MAREPWKNDGLSFDPGDATSWDEYLDEFERVMMPVFSRHGITKSAAIQAFMANRLYNVMSDYMEPEDGDA